MIWVAKPSLIEVAMSECRTSLPDEPRIASSRARVPPNSREKTGGNVKTGSALLLIFVLWFGWARYSEQTAARETSQERTAGYERCTAQLDEAGPCSWASDPVTPEVIACRAAKTTARQDCAEFWFGNPLENVTPRAPQGNDLDSRGMRARPLSDRFRVA